MGSRSSSTTIVQNNVNIIINMVNAAAHESPGITPIQAGTDAAGVEQGLQKALSTALAKAWTARFGTAPMDNVDMAFLQAPAVLTPGMDMTCAVDQINQDFDNWSVTGPANLANNIAQTILTKLIMEGGVIADSGGKKVLGPAQSVGWSAVTLTAQAGSGANVVHLIAYAFAAANF